MPDSQEPSYNIISLTENSITSPSPGALVDNVVEAEWVRRYPARRLRSWLRWPALLLKLALAAGCAWLFLTLPFGGLPSTVQSWKNPVVILLLVCYIGKNLLDTIFYDHYRP